jgi:hypothetical protein
MHNWPSQDNQRRYEQLASHIQAMCSAVSVELERDRGIPVRPVGWRCNEMCIEILEKKKIHVLVFVNITGTNALCKC